MNKIEPKVRTNVMERIKKKTENEDKKKKKKK